MTDPGRLGSPPRRDRRLDKIKHIEKLATVTAGSLGHYVLRYLRDLAIRNYSHHTIRGSRVCLRLFLVWCEDRGLVDPAEVTLSVLRRYQSHVFHHVKADGRRLSSIAQSDRVGAVRRFFAWMEDQGHLPSNPAVKLHLPRVEKHLPRSVLTAEEAEEVLAQPDLETAQGLRDRALLETLYATGMRRQEVEAMRVEDLDFAAGVVFVRQGKGRKDRMIPLSERAAAWLTRYLEEVRPRVLRGQDPGFVFLGRWGRPLSASQIAKIVQTCAQSADLGKEATCHTFRHTLATLMLEGGADIRYVQQMLGHATIATTEIYTHVAIRKLKEVHAATHPGAKLSRRGRAALEPAAAGERPLDPREELLSRFAAEAASEEAAETDEAGRGRAGLAEADAGDLEEP
jgi:integrase/recombinase XerD